jgi:hypothetical protein
MTVGISKPLAYIPLKRSSFKSMVSKEVKTSSPFVVVVSTDEPLENSVVILAMLIKIIERELRVVYYYEFIRAEVIHNDLIFCYMIICVYHELGGGGGAAFLLRKNRELNPGLT